MNKVILMGRLTRDPEIRYSQAQGEQLCIARYTLAVDRRFSRNQEQTADFINCVSFGKTAEFAEKYYKKGIKIAVTGRIQTGSYQNKEGQIVYTTEVVVEEQEFAESKNASGASGSTGSTSGSASGFQPGNASPSGASNEGFMNIPDGIVNDLPFK